MYKPNPIDTSDITLGDEFYALMESLAEQVHEVWAKGRADAGWTFGESRDDAKKQTPCLVPYSELPENEKEYDRNTAVETLKLIVKLGYEINFKGTAASSNNRSTTFLDPDEAYLLGEEYHKKRDYENAINYYRIAADKWHLLARCRIGEYYLHGRGVKADKERAFAILEPVAKQGIAEAQFLLGVFYHITSGHLDELKAREMYELAAKQGHIKAQFSLGNSFYHGYYNGAVNYAEAVNWYTIAANQGEPQAQYELGVCYETGRGVKQSTEEAILWYKKAAKQGESFARDRIKTLKGK